MTYKRKSRSQSYRKCCDTCTCKTKKIKIKFGEFEKPVFPWNYKEGCCKSKVLYFVFCCICRRDLKIHTLYVGNCKEKIKTRFSHARSRVRNFSKQPDFNSKQYTRLDLHFIEEHPEAELDKNIEIALISGVIENDKERSRIETTTKNELKLKTKHMENVKVLNR